MLLALNMSTSNWIAESMGLKSLPEANSAAEPRPKVISNIIAELENLNAAQLEIVEQDVAAITSGSPDDSSHRHLITSRLLHTSPVQTDVRASSELQIRDLDATVLGKCGQD
jgi:hypothetical protein